MRHLRPLLVLLVLLLVASCTSDPPEPVRVGAIYPLSGTQGMGGIDEYHGVRVAAELVNAEGGVGGRPGRGAIRFVADQLAPKLGRPASSLRFAIAAVDDVYGAAVADGARAELGDRDLETVADVAYDPRRYDPAKVVAEIAAARPDVLFVVAYLKDGVALRQEQVRQHLPLLASIGTSSSYCMPEFGALLGEDAVGLFASDKPDTHGINPSGLAPDAQALLERADAAYREAYGHSMSAAALAGFSGAWALFRHVLPEVSSMAPADVAAAARRVRVPAGGLPNGSGIEFAPPGGPDAGANLRAASVIWEWTEVNRREVTWPPQFATAEIAAIRPSR